MYNFYVFVLMKTEKKQTFEQEKRYATNWIVDRKGYVWMFINIYTNSKLSLLLWWVKKF